MEHPIPKRGKKSAGNMQDKYWMNKDAVLRYSSSGYSWFFFYSPPPLLTPFCEILWLASSLSSSAGRNLCAVLRYFTLDDPHPHLPLWITEAHGEVCKVNKSTCLRAEGKHQPTTYHQHVGIPSAMYRTVMSLDCTGWELEFWFTD